MDQNYFPPHHFAHPHHPHSSSQYQQQQQQSPFACQSREFYIPPPQTGLASSHPVVCDATFAEAQQQQQQAFIDSSQLDPFTNAEEGGPIGWVPPEERGFQHQTASNAIGTSNEVSVAFPTVDQQPQFAPTTFQQASPSNWSQPQPAANLGIYQMAGEAVAFHHQHHPHPHLAHQVQVPQDLSPGGIPGQPQSTASGITNVPHQAPISMLAPQAVYPSTLLDPASTSPSVPFRHQHQQRQHQQHGAAVAGGTQGYPQPAVAQGYSTDIQVQHQPHSHEGNNLSHPAYSTSSAAPSTGVQFAPVANPGVAPSSSPSASSSESLYPAGVYQQTACGSSESMAILNGAIPHHQQQLYSASGSYEAQSQYLAHHPQPSTRAQTFHSGLSDSNAPSNFITSPTASSTTSSSNPTHGGGAVCVQQPQPLAPSRTSSLAAWADVPPAPIVNPEHGPVPGLTHGVQDYHFQYHHHHHQADVVKEEQGVQFQQQPYSPVQQQHQPHQLKIEDVKPQLHQAYGAQELTIKPVSPQVLTQVPHHPGMSRSSTDVAVPRVQAQPLSRSATMPDMSASAAAAAAQRGANGPANGNTAALAPTRSVAEFDVAPRPVEAIKASETVRQAAKLHIDLGQADPNSPTSHEARLKARSLRRKGSAAPPPHGYSPYQREYAARRGSSASQHDEHAHQHVHAQQQPIVPSSRPTTALPTDQYGAQRTFIFNPYQDPSTLPVESGKQGHIPHGVPLPTPSVTAVVSGAPAATAQHQTIEFSGSAESMSPEDLGKGKALDRSAADAAALMMGEKKPFLACGFCRQRKIACGQRAPHPRDNEIGEGPRTCNQCARRHILCSFPSESRRGLRKTKPVTKTIIQEDGTEVTIVVEDEEEIEELEQAAPSKKSSKSKKKGRGPMEWIIAADAWLITPTAWAAHKAALEKKAAEGNGSMPGSSGAQTYQSAAFDDAPLSAGPSASAVLV